MALMLVAMLDGKEHYISELVDAVRKKKILSYLHDLSKYEVQAFYHAFETDDDAEPLMKIFSRIKKTINVFTEDRKVSNGPTPFLRYFALDTLKLHEVYNILFEINGSLCKGEIELDSDGTGENISQKAFLSLFVESPFFKAAMKNILFDYHELNDRFKRELENEAAQHPILKQRKWHDGKTIYEKEMEQYAENPRYFERVIEIVMISPSALSRFLKTYLHYHLEFLALDIKYNAERSLDEKEMDVLVTAFKAVRLCDFHAFYDRAKAYLVSDFYDNNLIGDRATHVHARVSLRLGKLNFPEFIGKRR